MNTYFICHAADRMQSKPALSSDMRVMTVLTNISLRTHHLESFNPLQKATSDAMIKSMCNGLLTISNTQSPSAVLLQTLINSLKQVSRFCSQSFNLSICSECSSISLRFSISLHVTLSNRIVSMHFR